MGLKGRWCRRQPSDDEMREELEAHVAMRAEHDRVDEAAARRRLGNLQRVPSGGRARLCVRIQAPSHTAQPAALARPIISMLDRRRDRRCP
jgi:hypothetical protein